MKYELKGKKFGKLTVLEKVGYDKGRYILWKCKCECGNETIVRSAHLVKGRIRSCGCLNYKANGFSRNRIYIIWKNMLRRCYNTKVKGFKRYGGRGITVCEEWKNDFMSFYNWALRNGYKENLSIDRVNNNSNYEPNNCRWTTALEQANNTRQNVRILYKGLDLTLAEWGRKIGIHPHSFSSRIKRYGICEKVFHRDMSNF